MEARHVMMPEKGRTNEGVSMPDKPTLAFLSHNKNDKAAAREIAMFLVSENINVWFDEWEVGPGDMITRNVGRGLDECTHFLLLWSKNARGSEWVNRELGAMLNKAIAEDSPRIIPILLDDAPIPGLLRDIHYVRYHGGTEEDRSEIVQAVSGHQPTQDFIRAVVQKYHEVIEDKDDPFGLAVCPKCGSANLKRGSHTTEAREYLFISCKECGWSDWT
jgi:hypothetical protein